MTFSHYSGSVVFRATAFWCVSGSLIIRERRRTLSLVRLGGLLSAARVGFDLIKFATAFRPFILKPLFLTTVIHEERNHDGGQKKNEKEGRLVGHNDFLLNPAK